MATIEEPTVTNNARLLAGFIAGALDRGDEYRASEWDPKNAGLVIKNSRTGNRFLVMVEQISGVE